MSDSVFLRSIDGVDIAAITALNNAAVPNVNALTEAALSDLVGKSEFARVAVGDEAVLGMILVFAPGAAYESLNYQWFEARYPDFLYVDRVIVAPQARGLGIGNMLYDALDGFAQGRAGRIACEVNERPPNPGSMRFHERLGFRTVGSQETEGGAKSVALMIKELS